MVDTQVESAETHKRKISESPEPQDSAAKRIKVGEQNGHDDHVEVSDTDKASGDVTKQEEITGAGAGAVADNNKTPAERPNTSSSRGSRDGTTTAVRPPREEAEQPQPQPQSIEPASRRPDFRVEEKKRGKRLFGGLLSALNQNKPNNHQVKRQEIERRQHERAHQQQLEDDKRRAEKLSRLTRVREIEQVRFDEQVMQTRHSNMLAMANSLQTRSEPRIFYRPWLMTERQEEKIADQIRDAEEVVDREVQYFKRHKERRLREFGTFDSSRSEGHDAGEPVPSRDTNPRLRESKPSQDKDPDEMGDDEMEHDKEDAVLY